MRAVLEDARFVFTSDLTLVECDRSLVRLEVAERLSPVETAERRAILAELTRHWSLLRLDEEIISRARSRFPYEPIRTLDALHLASALLASRLVGGVTMLSLDQRVRRAGRGVGLALLPSEIMPPES